MEPFGADRSAQRLSTFTTPLEIENAVVLKSGATCPNYGHRQFLYTSIFNVLPMARILINFKRLADGTHLDQERVQVVAAHLLLNIFPTDARKLFGRPSFAGSKN